MHDILDRHLLLEEQEALGSLRVSTTRLPPAHHRLATEQLTYLAPLGRGDTCQLSHRCTAPRVFASVIATRVETRTGRAHGFEGCLHGIEVLRLKGMDLIPDMRGNITQKNWVNCTAAYLRAS